MHAASHAWSMCVYIFIIYASYNDYYYYEYCENNWEQNCLCAKILKERENGAQSKDEFGKFLGHIKQIRLMCY